MLPGGPPLVTYCTQMYILSCGRRPTARKRIHMRSTYSLNGHESVLCVPRCAFDASSPAHPPQPAPMMAVQPPSCLTDQRCNANERDKLEDLEALALPRVRLEAAAHAEVADQIVQRRARGKVLPPPSRWRLLKLAHSSRRTTRCCLHNTRVSLDVIDHEPPPACRRATPRSSNVSHWPSTSGSSVPAGLCDASSGARPRENPTF